jgi:hypothetical protein
MTIAYRNTADWRREPPPAPSPPRIPIALREIVEHGLHLHPCYAAAGDICTCLAGAKCPSPGKHPILARWQDIATTDQEQIARWISRHIGCNWGIATGIKSGVCVLDIDPRNGGDEALAGHEAKHGPLPATWECLTGGGGRHLFFRLPGDGNVKSKNDVLGKGLDFKANGGFVIAAGSMHASGRRYEWSVDGHPDHEALADCPAWIVAALERYTPTAVAIGKISVSADQWRERAKGIVHQGQRTQRLTEVCGLLLRKNVEPYLILALLLGWNVRSFKPPLPEAKVVKTVTRIMARDAARREKQNAA